MKTLYCRDVKGNILTASLEIKGNRLVYTYGKLKGKQITREYKNVLPHILQEKEHRIITDLINRGYIENEFKIPEGDFVKNLPMQLRDKNEFLKPMKAILFKENSFKYPALLQAKIDGVRCTITFVKNPEKKDLFSPEEEVIILSKEGNRYHLPHIEKWFMDRKEELFIKPFLKYGRDMIYDGELYIKDTYLDVIRTYIPIEIDSTISRPLRGNKKELVQFWWFDLSIELSQKERFVIMRELSPLVTDDSPVVIVPYLFVNSDSEALENSKKFYDSGFEGGILRDLDAVYEFGRRVSSMQKIKFSKTAKFTIVDVLLKNEENINNTIRTHITFKLVTDSGIEFESVPLGDENLRLEYLNNKELYIGKKAIVKYMSISSYGIPIHSNVLTIN